MREFDLTPLYRSAIGFDRLANMIDNAKSADNQPSFPPYNIELTGENQYRITMAVAGFENDELDIQSESSSLTITGQKKAQPQETHYLYQGIAARNFERRFQLADHVKVIKASMENGLLHVDLIHEIPEAMKPRKIQIDA